MASKNLLTSDAQYAARKASYGVDAPYLLPIPIIVVVINVINGIASKSLWPFVGAGLVTCCCALGLYVSRQGKFVVWAELLDKLKLRENARILDLGCGRGAVLLLAAQRLTTGKAVGVDIWKKTDQSGNAADATLRNAAVEGVLDRVELHTASMTELPFANDSFDLVLSNVAVHNVKGRERRNKVMEEAVRVLRPGGQLLIADIIATGQYCDCLIKLGMRDVTRRSLGWRMWWSGPWMATRLVTATKPVN